MPFLKMSSCKALPSCSALFQREGRFFQNDNVRKVTNEYKRSNLGWAEVLDECLQFSLNPNHT